MRDNPGNPAYKQSELLDVELLDVFAEIEAMLRCGREVQRDALRVRGLPTPTSAAQRLDAARSIRKHLANMTEQCQALAAVLRDLDETAAELERLLEGEEVSRSDSSRQALGTSGTESAGADSQGKRLGTGCVATLDPSGASRYPLTGGLTPDAGTRGMHVRMQSGCSGSR